MTTTSSTTFDFDTLRRAIEERDAARIGGLYAPDAEVRQIDDDHPPGAPRTLHGSRRSPRTTVTSAAGT